MTYLASAEYMATHPITKRQKEMLAFIVKSIRKNQRPPSVREIGAAMGISSPNGVSGKLKALANRGLIELDADCGSRGIKVPSLNGKCPFCGK